MKKNRIGKTRDLFKITGDIKEIYHARMGMIKNRNVKDLTEAEAIKKRWQEYTDVLVAQSCPTLCDPLCYSPLVSSVHGILQTRTLEWVAISFSRASSQPRDQTWVSHIAGRLFTV